MLPFLFLIVDIPGEVTAVPGQLDLEYFIVSATHYSTWLSMSQRLGLNFKLGL
jgi:hypothetical protein